MGKYKEIQIEVSDEVYAALEQLADDLNKAETIILNRTGKQERKTCGSFCVQRWRMLLKCGKILPGEWGRKPGRSFCCRCFCFY